MLERLAICARHCGLRWSIRRVGDLAGGRVSTTGCPTGSPIDQQRGVVAAVSSPLPGCSSKRPRCAPVATDGAGLSA
jgi:hypothetical protein